MVKLLTYEQDTYLREIAPGKYNEDIAIMINEKFGSTFTWQQIKQYKQRYKISSGMQHKGAREPKTLLTEEQGKYLRSVNFGHSATEVAEMLNKKFGLNLITASQVKSYRSRNKLPPCGFTGRFEKGHTSHTKGKKFPGRGSCTSFKTGHTPHNTLPIGTRIKREDGYTYEKIAEPDVWKQVSYLVWEEANGKMPENSIIIFADKNTENIKLDNLILINRSELLVANKKGLLYDDANLTKTGILVAKIISKVGRLKNKKHKGWRRG